MNTLTITRDQKIQGPTKKGYFSSGVLPDGTLLQFMDTGDVQPGQYEVNFEPSPHLTYVHNSPKIKNLSMQWVINAIWPQAGTTPDPQIEIVWAYRIHHAKLADGSVSEDILFHAGAWLKDTLDCFLTGLDRVLLRENQATGEQEPSIETAPGRSLLAKNIMIEKLGKQTFQLNLQNNAAVGSSSPA